MSQKLIQLQEQRQIQTATLQQMQLSHLLELPADAMAEELQKAIDDNPALERDVEEYDDTQEWSPETAGRSADYFADRQSDIRVRRSNEEAEEGMEAWLSDTDTDADAILRQISELELTPTERQAMEYIAGSLSDDGYLEKDDDTLADELAFGLYIDLTPSEIHTLVSQLQTFEPAGLGAHTLQECLHLQLQNKIDDLRHSKGGVERQQEQEVVATALRIVDKAWDDYAARRWTHLQQALNIDETLLQKADQEIRRCNPRPGAALTQATRTSAPTVTPDFILTVEEGGHIEVELTRGHEPNLRVSATFQRIVDEYADLRQPTRNQQDNYIYAKDRVDRARNYIDTLRRRRETLLATMREIARRQRDFFLGEDDDTLLRPLKLQDVAERVGLDISAISRAANSKYVETLYGIYPLRHFFNAQTMEKDGELVSSTQLKVALREIIDSEPADAPYSDERLTQLMTERGYKIARRTIAKYRTQLNILSAQYRKR